jgi:hypothetical protein
MRRAKHEHYRGYGVMALPFDSGHVLALRVMPENDFAPYASVWHRTPEGAWSMYVDGPHPELLCPRLYGPALAHSGPARIEVSRPGRGTLRVRMKVPSLDWTLRLRSTPLTRLVNGLLPHIPRALYRQRPSLALVRAVADRALNLGSVDFAGTLPAGQRVLIQPQRLFLIGESRAVLDGTELGRPVRADSNPATGSFHWPAAGVFAQGDIWVEIDDEEEHRRRLKVFRRTAAAAAGARSRASW